MQLIIVYCMLRGSHTLVCWIKSKDVHFLLCTQYLLLLSLKTEHFHYLQQWYSGNSNCLQKKQYYLNEYLWWLTRIPADLDRLPWNLRRVNPLNFHSSRHPRKAKKIEFLLAFVDQQHFAILEYLKPSHLAHHCWYKVFLLL